MAESVSSTRLTTRCHSTGRQRDTLRQAGWHMGGRETGASFGPARKVRARQRLQGRRRRSYEHLPPPSARRTKVEPAQNATAPPTHRAKLLGGNKLATMRLSALLHSGCSVARPELRKVPVAQRPIRLFASTQFEMNSNKNSPVHMSSAFTFLST